MAVAEQPSPWRGGVAPTRSPRSAGRCMDVRDRAALGALCRFAAAQTARTSASRLTANWSVPLGVPADRGPPCGLCLRGDVVRVVVETGGVVRQCQVELGDVDVRLVPVDHRDAIDDRQPGRWGQPWVN